MLRNKEKAQLTPLDRIVGWARFLGDVAERLKALVSQISGDSGKGCAPVGSNPTISVQLQPRSCVNNCEAI
jgi:hypothetical protein